MIVANDLRDDNKRPKQPIRKKRTGGANDSLKPDSYFTPTLDAVIAEQRKEAQLFLQGVWKLAEPSGGREPLGLQYESPTHNFGQIQRSQPSPFDELLADTGVTVGLPSAPETAAAQPQQQALSEAKEILWADPELWQLVADNKPASVISGYLRRIHSVEVPPVPAQAWREMVRNPAKRQELFALLQIRFVDDQNSVAYEEICEKLPPRLIGQLARHYLESPTNDYRHLVASHRLSASALACLRQFLVRLNADFTWCEKHPEVIPPPLAPKPRHRRREVEQVRQIEGLVTRLLADSSLSNYKLARDEKGRVSDAVRMLAAKAKKLIELREQVRVANYSERRDGRTIGRKPRQRSGTRK
jgi:hypothetical protein